LGTRRGVELLIQQRHKLTPDIRVSDEPPICHRYIWRKSQFPSNRDTGLATLLTTGVEKSQIASGRRTVGISQ
jgi:hypothetical protein